MDQWAKAFCIIDEESPEYEDACDLLQEEQTPAETPKRRRIEEYASRVDEIAFSCVGYYLNENGLEMDEAGAEFCYTSYIYFSLKLRENYSARLKQLCLPYTLGPYKRYRKGGSYSAFRNEALPYVIEDQLRRGILRWFTSLVKEDKVLSKVEYDADWTFKE